MWALGGQGCVQKQRVPSGVGMRVWRERQRETKKETETKNLPLWNVHTWIEMLHVQVMEYRNDCTTRSHRSSGADKHKPINRWINQVMYDGNREDRTSPSAGEANFGEWLTFKWDFQGWPEVLQMERKLHSGRMDNCAKAQGLKGPGIQRRPAWPSVRAAVDGAESRRQPGDRPLFGDLCIGQQGPQPYFMNQGLVWLIKIQVWGSMKERSE